MAPKKAAKKAAKKAVGHGKRAEDTRRCYEHFGRISTLLPQLRTEADTLTRLVMLAKQILSEGDAKNAADLLRAGEHFAFGTLAAGAQEQEQISDGLQKTLEEEYSRLIERSREHASAAELAPAVRRLLSIFQKAAASAYKAKRFRAASELARGAEALSHVDIQTSYRLKTGDIHQLLPAEKVG